MFNRIKAVFLALAMVFSVSMVTVNAMAEGPAPSSNTITIASVNGAPGSKVSVPVTIETKDAVNAVGFAIYYGNYLKLDSVNVDGAVINSAEFMSNLQYRKPNQAKFLVSLFANSRTLNGLLFTMNFTIKDNATGKLNVEFSSDTAQMMTDATPDANYVTVTANNGSVTTPGSDIPDPMPVAPDPNPNPNPNPNPSPVGESLTIGSVNGTAGSTVSVPITIDAKDKVSGIGFAISYSSNLTLTSTTLNTGLTDSGSFTQNLAYNTNGAKFLFSWVANPKTASGTLLTLNFVVKSGASGPQSVTFNTGDVSPLNMMTDDTQEINYLPVTITNGSINVPAANNGGSTNGGSTGGGSTGSKSESSSSKETHAINIPQGSMTQVIKTDTGTVTVPSNMLSNISGLDGKKVELTTKKVDPSTLSHDAQTLIGGRPVIDLSLVIDGQTTVWNNPNAPVTVSVQYTPAASEDANSIVIYYIDGQGKLNYIPNGHYKNGAVTFSTTHFSTYAVGYNPVTFSDVNSNAWYSSAVHFLAARQITSGTGNGDFNPDAQLTRGQFIVFLMNAYNIAPDSKANDNFADAGNTYYTAYLAAAKKLGIAKGVGNNKFNPDSEITREQMFTLLYNALKNVGLPTGVSNKTLSDFTDASQVDTWAQDAVSTFVKSGVVSGSENRLMPLDTTTRAQMAQVLYNLLNR